jgi:hypothetical protein
MTVWSGPVLPSSSERVAAFGVGHDAGCVRIRVWIEIAWRTARRRPGTRSWPAAHGGGAATVIPHRSPAGAGSLTALGRLRRRLFHGQHPNMTSIFVWPGDAACPSRDWRRAGSCPHLRHVTEVMHLSALQSNVCSSLWVARCRGRVLCRPRIPTVALLARPVRASTRLGLHSLVHRTLLWIAPAGTGRQGG